MELRRRGLETAGSSHLRCTGRAVSPHCQDGGTVGRKEEGSRVRAWQQITCLLPYDQVDRNFNSTRHMSLDAAKFPVMLWHGELTE